MKYIDITTAHNISIRYELASTLHRILAWILDMLVIVIYASIMSFATFGSESLMILVIVIPISFYHLIFETLMNGQSPGKRLLKLKVVTLNGRTAKSKDYFLRWVFRLIDITFSFGMVGTLFVSSTQKNQRIGDILAQTTIVKLKADRFFDLKSLLNLSKQKVEIEYPKLIMYRDEDMMLVKESLIRYKRYPSEANKRFIKNLAGKIADDLEVKKDKLKTGKFLEQVLQEYILLTR